MNAQTDNNFEAIELLHAYTAALVSGDLDFFDEQEIVESLNDTLAAFKNQKLIWDEAYDISWLFEMFKNAVNIEEHWMMASNTEIAYLEEDSYKLLEEYYAGVFPTTGQSTDLGLLDLLCEMVDRSHTIATGFIPPTNHQAFIQVLRDHLDTSHGDMLVAYKTDFLKELAVAIDDQTYTGEEDVRHLTNELCFKLSVDYNQMLFPTLVEYGEQDEHSIYLLLCGVMTQEYCNVLDQLKDLEIFRDERFTNTHAITLLANSL